MTTNDIKWKGYQTSRLYKSIVSIQHHNHINDRIVEKQQQTLIRMKTREMYPF